MAVKSSDECYIKIPPTRLITISVLWATANLAIIADGHTEQRKHPNIKGDDERVICRSLHLVTKITHQIHCLCTGHPRDQKFSKNVPLCIMYSFGMYVQCCIETSGPGTRKSSSCSSSISETNYQCGEPGRSFGCGF